MQVAPDGTPRLEFFDAAGKVIHSLPDSASAPKP
jgi:thioredoxin-related protein